MAEAGDVYGSIYQNLIDAGCDAQTTEQCMACVKEKRIAEMIPVLSKHRASLLESVHIGQRKLYCLDFLIYKIKKSSK